MKLLFLVFMLSSISYTQTFNMQYNKISANEIHFTTVYKGPSTEIILPRRGRVIALAEQSDLNTGSGSIRVGIRVGSDPNQEYTVRFTYSLILPNQGGFGSISENWYPSLQNGDATYNISSLVQNTGMFIYPYTKYENNIFSFSVAQNAKLAVFPYTVVQFSETETPITIFTANQWETSAQDIQAVQDYMNEYLGKQDIQNIVIINSTLASDKSFFDNNTLYLNIPGRGTIIQIREAFSSAWQGVLKENLSVRLFNMFKDTIFRLVALNVNPTEVEDEANPSEIDLGKSVLIPPNSYYQNVFQQGFETNTVQPVDVEGILNNYALLHLAQYNIGTNTVIEGIKAYFNEAPTDEEPITNTEEEEEVTTTKESTNKKDTELVNWNTITQNKLQEPLFSLYTKEILPEKGIIPLLTAKENVVSRNSFNIPDFRLTDSDGNAIDIQWNDFRSININVSNGNYCLDAERTVPQQSFIESYYSFDTNTQILRNRLISMAERQKAPGEINLRKHLEIVQFPVETANAFNVDTGNTVFVIISHILSNTTGTLKPALKESFFSVDPEGKITYLNTRLRV
ncbi:MAG: hypothetical protein ACRCWI_00240 [Brevinema sp.]